MRTNRKLVALVVLLVLLNVGCAKKVTPHPNQINSFDGQVYDTLITAQATLDEAKVQFKAGKLPAESKFVINAAGRSYDAARSSWQTWRDVELGVKQGDPVALQNALTTDLNQLAASIAQVVKLIQGATK